MTTTLTMTHAADALGSIQREIQRLEANIDKLKKKIGDVQALKDRTEDQRSDLKRWCMERGNYEAELMKAREKEQKVLSTRGESCSPCWFDICLSCVSSAIAGLIIVCSLSLNCDGLVRVTVILFSSF